MAVPPSRATRAAGLMSSWRRFSPRRGPPSGNFDPVTSTDGAGGAADWLAPGLLHRGGEEDILSDIAWLIVAVTAGALAAIGWIARERWIMRRRRR
jgi:hypothetical protein